MNLFERMVFEPRGGMFREFSGINAFFAPHDVPLYRKLLPSQFGMPDQPVVMFFAADYTKVFPWPITRDQEWAVGLRCIAGSREGWYVTTMPVTKWVPLKGGRYLGFPKYIADSITLEKRGDVWQAEGMYRGSRQVLAEFRPGITRELAAWEKELLDNKAFFNGDACLLVPPGKGPRAQRVQLVHQVPPEWSPEVGMVRIEVVQSEPWAGLVPGGTSFPGKYTHFRGGINLVAEKLG